MIPSSSEISPRQRACAAVLPAMILGARALAQSNAVADAKALVAKIEQARGVPARPVKTLRIEGTFAVTIEGVADGQPCVEGKFREIHSGETRARTTVDMGEHGLMESGITDEVVWEIDPVAGARILTDGDAAAVRRSSALSRGASPTSLYVELATAGTKAIDGREHALLRGTPRGGPADTWFVDRETGLVSRIDITLPSPEGAELVWGLDRRIETQVTFGDWMKIDGVQYPHRRSATMGIVTFTHTCSKIEPGAALDASAFDLPEAVTKLKGKPVAKPSKAGSAAYQIVDREPQAVASIHTKCKLTEMGPTIAPLYPEVMAHLNATGVQITGTPFLRYHVVNADELEVEAGMPVAKRIVEEGRVKNSELPGGKTVVAWHVGPYEKLPAAHEALKAWVTANRLKSRGGPWEVYWTDPGVVTDPSKWRTQLFMPIEN